MEISKLPQSVRKHIANPNPRLVNGRIIYDITFHHGTKMKKRMLRICGISEQGHLVLQNGNYGLYVVPVDDIVLMKRA